VCGTIISVNYLGKMELSSVFISQHTNLQCFVTISYCPRIQENVQQNMGILTQIKDTPSFKITNQEAQLGKSADPLFQPTIKEECSRILCSFLVIKTRKVSLKNQFLIEDPGQHLAARGDSEDDHPQPFFRSCIGKHCW